MEIKKKQIQVVNADYRKAHPGTTVPVNECDQCDNCIMGVELMYSQFMFPQLDCSYSCTDEQVEFERLYCLECKFCNNMHPGKLEKCSNCDEEFWNRDIKTNDRCIVCIWLKNKALPKKRNEYMLILDDSLPYCEKNVIELDNGCKYVKVNMHSIWTNVMALFNAAEKEQANKERIDQKETKEKSKKERAVPFGYAPIVQQKKKKRNKKNKNKKN